MIGNMLGVQVGEHVRLEGEWTIHGQYGRQFKVERYASVLPATAAGIEKYLGSGLIKGVGPVTAKRIVRKFGADTLHVIDETAGAAARGAGRRPQAGAPDQDAPGTSSARSAR